MELIKYILLCALGIASHLGALPAEVLIIRHAEKAADGFLSLKGKERAAALVPFFAENRELTAHGTPVAIYAKQYLPEQHPQRTQHTVQGLADKVRVSINASFSNDNYQEMIQEIKSNPSYHGKLVLICWGHEVIPDIARAFGALQAPATWPGNIFDRVWKISFSSLDGCPTFQNIPQRLMFDDSAF